MCDDTPAWPAEDLACEPGQEPRGCRYIEGDVLDKENPWRYCQADMLPGHHPGSLAKPPYCADHMRLVCEPDTEAKRRSRERFLERIAQGDEYHPDNVPDWVELCGGTMPVDMYLSHNYTPPKGFSHD